MSPVTGPGLFHPAQDIHAVMPHLFRAAERFEQASGDRLLLFFPRCICSGRSAVVCFFRLQRPLRELGGRPAGSAPKTPCWFETSDDGGSGGGADEVQ